MPGRDKVQDPEAGSQGPGPSWELRAEGQRIPGGVLEVLSCMF